VLYKNAGDLNQAMDDYSRSLVLDPKNSDSWSNKGLIFWQEALGDNAHKAQLTDSALIYVNKAIKIKPDFATAYGNKGSILSTMGDQEGAIQAFTKSIELDPYFAESYYNRGIVKYNLGRRGEACPDLKQAAELGYAHSGDAFRDLCK
jgi:tetratricopeptide (TPR) repeat protein